MAEDRSDSLPRLLGRRPECGALEGLLNEADAGRSGVVVLRGEAGVGKSALLDFLRDRAADWQLVRARGVESEMELAYSGLHQLCLPLLGRIDGLPVPQRDALSVVFGLSTGPPPERFLVALATLTLLAEAAEQGPLGCLIDDAQWLDTASANVLAFVARRVLVERIAFVFATRTETGGDILGGLPEMRIGGLGSTDSRSLLLANVQGPLDAAICEQIIAESRGNPLALLELPRTWVAGQLAGGFGFPGGHRISSRIEESYARRIQELPSETQILLLTAAAEPIGSAALLRGAANALGLDMSAIDPAVVAHLVSLDGRVEFAHPLVRSAVYRSADAEARRRAHQALAAATDPDLDPDRRAWHRARAAVGPDDEVASELASSADRAQDRGGYAAAAAFLQRAAALTADPALRTARALDAAIANLRAGALDQASSQLVTAEDGLLDESQRARVAVVRAEIAYATDPIGGESPYLLASAAERFAAVDLPEIREAYIGAAIGAVTMASDTGPLLEMHRILGPSNGPPSPLELLADCMMQVVTEGHAAAVPALRRAADRLRDLPLDDILRWGWHAGSPSAVLWDLETYDAILARQTTVVRAAGALVMLPVILAAQSVSRMWLGDFAGTAAMIAEFESLGAVTGVFLDPLVQARFHALRGDQDAAELAIAQVLERASVEDQSTALNAHLAAAILFNGQARYEEATSRSALAARGLYPLPRIWALPELIEAASHSGQPEVARAAYDELVLSTQASGHDIALGLEARSRALVSDGNRDDDFCEAIERLTRTALRTELARTHLLYGEWLRRDGRRTDARAQLQTAHEQLTEIGMEAFADRARRELAATGLTVRKRTDDARNQLTPQETQIAQLARDGLSNPEIGSQLFISARTVEWHLRNVFTKLGISTRRQLRTMSSLSGVRTPGPPG